MQTGQAHPREAEAHRSRTARLRLALALLGVVPLGFAAKLWRGPGSDWLGDHGAGLFYEVFWILVVLCIRPALDARRVAVAVLAVTCALEVLQLWHPPWLEAIRRTFLGHALIGSTFGWLDFPHYVAGCLLGAVLGARLSGDRGPRPGPGPGPAGPRADGSPRSGRRPAGAGGPP